MFAAKNVDQNFFKLVSYSEGKTTKELVLDQDQILIGRAKNCDFIIDEDSISHYHAILELSSNGPILRDLGSQNGIYINGERKEIAHLLEGDRVEIGGSQFLLEETILSDRKLKLVNDETVDLERSKMPDLPPLPPKEGLEVIDGEYCDIVFDHSDIKSTNELGLDNLVMDEYIEFDERNQTEGLLKSRTSQSLEVVVTSLGVALSVDYLSLKFKSIKLSGKEYYKKGVYLPILSQDEELELATVNGSTISYKDIEGFSRDKVGDTTVYTKGNIQLFIKPSTTPPSLRPASLIERDKNLYKQGGTVFGALMSIMLLLLLIDSPEPPKEEKRVVIFKKSVKGPTVTEKKSMEVAKKDVDKGIQKKDISEKTPKMAKAKAAPKKVVKKVSKAKPKQQKVAKKPVKKRFKLKVAKGLTKFMNKKFDFKTKSTKSTSSTAVAATSKSSTVSASATSFNTNVNDGRAKLGSSNFGNAATAQGLKGLASKKGIATAYSTPKTVVLGSIDPELLRKILREYLPQFHYCYQNELEKKQDLIKGIVDLKFRINGNGKVSNIKIASKGASFSRKGSNCMASVLKMIEFPMPKGGGIVDVKQPLNFQSERSKI